MYVEIVGGTAIADASWNVATTSHGTVMMGAASQATIGNTPFADVGLLTFTIPLGSTFELLVDYDLSTSGSGAGADSTSEITASLVQISAELAPPMTFLPVSGTKLLMIDKYASSSKAKVVLLLKDATPGSIAVGPAADPPQLSGTLEIFPLADPSNRAVYDLDTIGWFKHKDEVAKYKNTSAGAGASGVRIVTVKPDKLIKVVARNLGDGDAATGDQDANDLDLGALTTGDSVIVAVTIDNASDTSSHRMCAQFDSPSIKAIAGGSGVKYLSKTSSLPGSCPPQQPVEKQVAGCKRSLHDRATRTAIDEPPSGERPRHLHTRVRPIATERTGVDRRLQVASQVGVASGNAANYGLDGARDIDAGALGARAGAAIAAAEADGAGQFAGDEFDLLSGVFGPTGVIEARRLVQFLAQICQSALVLRARLRVEDSGTGVGVRGRVHTESEQLRLAGGCERGGTLAEPVTFADDQIEHMKLALGITQELRDVVQPFAIFEPHQCLTVAGSPEFAFATEEVRPATGTSSDRSPPPAHRATRLHRSANATGPAWRER